MSVNVSLRDVDMRLLVKAMRAYVASDLRENGRLTKLIERLERHIVVYPEKNAKAEALIRRLKRERDYSKPRRKLIP